MSKPNHPDVVLKRLLDSKPRPQKLRNLQSLHEICGASYETGERDFSVAAIGKLCEKHGLLKARGLYNAPLADYRTLIAAWAAYAGPVVPKPKLQLATEDYVNRIDDPAVRMLVQKVISERNKLKAQLNTLRAATTVVIDRRPVESLTAKTPFEPANGLTDSERKALLKTLSPAFLAEHGWTEMEFGEIVNSRGRTLFDPGFATGLRKLIGNA
ncbi:hypothetical protein B0G71_6393 [Paraburkholderia sp. BL27I4N3]|uniref:gamma-mobile-trio protein GmtX n=1 Tax=Paraburkholderia sp. BL27I4N3 TaxID=1938805 RepID=UPI000E221CB5|nr:gamma-mobile-trio protein GmtX [Paraburkholderia sp. BL27I4N3]REE23155.1 hypothetical protein B0G71_6393 [Paraburkholderia sp. BL27I4N3]